MNSSQTDNVPTRWLSVDQAALYLGCSRNFLDKDRVTRLHGIPFAKLGRHIRYDRNALDEFLLAHTDCCNTCMEAMK